MKDKATFKEHTIATFVKMWQEAEELDKKALQKRQDWAEYGYLATLAHPDFIDKAATRMKRRTGMNSEWILEKMLLFYKKLSLWDMPDRLKDEDSRQWMLRVEDAMIKARRTTDEKAEEKRQLHEADRNLNKWPGSS